MITCFESLERRALLSTTMAFDGFRFAPASHLGAGVGASWSDSGATPTGVLVQGTNNNHSAQITLHLTGLPAHSMVQLSWSLNGADSPAPYEGKIDTLVFSYAGKSASQQILFHAGQNQGLPLTPVGAGRWKAASDASLDIGISSPDLGSDSISISHITVNVYQPTVTASGGGTATEGTPGAIPFTITRDLPSGYQGTTAGDEAIPDTTVNVNRSGSAASSRYAAAGGSDPLPNGSATISDSADHKTYTIVPVNDSIAESHEGHPEDTDEIDWTVYGTGADGQVSTPLHGFIQDNAQWYYDTAWKVDAKPYDYAVQDLHTYTEPGGGGNIAYTDHYYLVDEWRPVTTISDVSDDFGQTAEKSGSMSFSTSQSYGYGGSVDIDLSSYIKIPVTVHGNVSTQETVTTGTSGNVSVSKAGATDTMYAVAVYARYQYVLTIEDIPEQYVYDFSLQDNVYYPHSVHTFTNNLGFTGDTSSSFIAEIKRYWLDPESPQTIGLTTSNVPSYSFPTIEPSNLPS